MKTNPSHILSKKMLAYNTIKQKILSNSLKPLDPINEKIFIEELRISKTPIREAIQQLVSEGLILNLPRKGTFVSAVTIEDIKEIFEIREIIECGASRIAAMQIDLNTLKQLRKDKGPNLLASYDKALDFIEPANRVHALIIGSIDNKRLLNIYKMLWGNFERIRILFVKKYEPERLKEIHAEHIEIIDALSKRDPGLAEKAMRKHLVNSVERIKTLI